MDCQQDWIAKIETLKRLLVCSMDDITKRASALPPEQREVYRRLYRKRQARWRWCVEQLEPAEVMA